MTKKNKKKEPDFRAQTHILPATLHPVDLSLSELQSPPRCFLLSQLLFKKRKSWGCCWNGLFPSWLSISCMSNAESTPETSCSSLLIHIRISASTKIYCTFSRLGIVPSARDSMMSKKNVVPTFMESANLLRESLGYYIVTQMLWPHLVQKVRILFL